MKIPIYFFSCFSLLVLVGCSPEQQCFNAHMKLFEESKKTYAQFAEDWKDYERYEYMQNRIREKNAGNWRYNREKNRWISKSQWEAWAWSKCMKK